MLIICLWSTTCAPDAVPGTKDSVGNKARKAPLSRILDLSGETDYDRMLPDIGWTFPLLRLMTGLRAKEKGLEYLTL